MLTETPIFISGRPNSRMGPLINLGMKGLVPKQPTPGLNHSVCMAKEIDGLPGASAIVLQVHHSARVWKKSSSDLEAASQHD